MSFPPTSTSARQATHIAVTVALEVREMQLTRVQDSAEQDPQG